MPLVLQDLKTAIRRLLKSPGFAATALLMLALGIGATTSIFSLVEGVLLRPLPFPDSKRLMVLSDILQEADTPGESGVTAPDIRNYMRDTSSFSDLGGYEQDSYELSGTGDPAVVNGTRMSSGIFAALGVEPELGRVFTQQEDVEHQQLAVLSYATWQDRFHRDPRVLGVKVLLNRKPYTIIGVMPRNFEFPLLPGRLNHNELWVPLSLLPQELTGGAARWTFQMVGRLRPGVTAARAERDAASVAGETVRNYPAFMAGFRIRAVVRPLHEETVEEALPLVRTLFLAAIVLLLIVCANLAGLLLVRAIQRRRELAVRLALGAGFVGLLRQEILESLLLSLTGGLVGLGLTAFVLRVGLGLLPESLPRINEVRLDWPIVGFALSLAVLTGLICGLASGFAALRTNVNDMLKEGGRNASAGGRRLRSALVIVEIANALVLLALSGLLLRSFEKMRQVNLGFQPDHTLVASYGLPREKYATRVAIKEFNTELMHRLRQLPGVTSVGLSTTLPASGNFGYSEFSAEGELLAKNKSLNVATVGMIEGDYFRAMGISLLQGRLFTAADVEDSPLVVIVNQNLAEQSWPAQNPIGKRLREGTQSMQTPWATVVGVVANVRQGSPDSLLMQQFYMPATQAVAMAGPLAFPTYLPGNAGYIVVRTSLLSEPMEHTLRATVFSMDGQLPLTQVQTMEDAISASEAPRRFNTVLISSFAIAAVLLAMSGIYGVIAFSVALRAQEMAIRLALGSPRSEIVRLVLVSGASLGTIGSSIGLLGAAAAAHMLGSLLFGVNTFDPMTLVSAGMLMLLLSLAASLPPALLASSVDPLSVLRTE